MQWRVQMDPDDEAANVAGESGEDSELEEIVARDASLGEFVAVKPWLGTIVPPTNPPKPTRKGPEVALELECVHGYRAQDARNNALYNYKGDVVYSTAALGVIYNKEHHRQRFFNRHEGDIISLAMHPSGQYVATGDRHLRPTVWIWDATSGNPICAFKGMHRQSVPVLAFSAKSVDNGNKLVTVGRDENHCVAVYHTNTGNWDDGRLQCYAQAGKQDILFACFIGGGGQFDIMTGGVHTVTFWKILGSGSLIPTRAYFGRRGKVQCLTCACSVRQLIVTGCVSGHLYTWDQEKRTIMQSVKAHAKTINSISAKTTLKGDYFVTGGKDGVIKLWNLSMHCVKAFDMRESRPPPRNPSVRSVTINDVGNTILVGTQGSELFEITNIQATADITGATLLQRGHFAFELWGLAPHPTDPDVFATVGDDCTLRIWSAEHRRPNHEMTIETMSRAVAWSPSGDFIALGLGGHTRKGRSNKDGAFIIINSSTMLVEHEGRDSREWITDAKYSPDGKMLALSSNDNLIYLYNADDGYPLISKCEKHSASVRHVDFTKNGAYLQSNCTAFELLYFNTSDGVVIFNPSNLKDEQWASWTCTLGWPVQGVWEDSADGSADATCVHKANSHDVVAVGREGGAIKLFQWPALVKRAGAVDGFGYSSAVGNVRFLADDKRLITISRDSRTICQWKVIWPAPPEEEFDSDDDGDAGVGGAVPKVIAGAGGGVSK
jgi:microtubule-associated protein-like 6